MCSHGYSESKYAIDCKLFKFYFILIKNSILTFRIRSDFTPSSKWIKIYLKALSTLSPPITLR